MARIITLANFIHFNMPHGVDYLDAQIGVEDARGIAAFVLSAAASCRPRPRFSEFVG
jgi:thiosulfate dehydrogenase